MLTAKNNPKTCWICGKAIDLEGCKVDEHGLPVHEPCYIAKVGLDLKHNPPLKRPGA